jgi:hypothetical protein
MMSGIFLQWRNWLSVLLRGHVPSCSPRPRGMWLRDGRRRVWWKRVDLVEMVVVEMVVMGMGMVEMEII